MYNFVLNIALFTKLQIHREDKALYDLQVYIILLHQTSFAVISWKLLHLLYRTFHQISNIQHLININPFLLMYQLAQGNFESLDPTSSQIIQVIISILVFFALPSPTTVVVAKDTLPAIATTTTQVSTTRKVNIIKTIFLFIHKENTIQTILFFMPMLFYLNTMIRIGTST